MNELANSVLASLPLILYWIFILIYLVGAFFIVYHLARFGLGLKPRILMIVFLIGAGLLLSLNFELFSKVDWSQFYDFFSIPKIL